MLNSAIGCVLAFFKSASQTRLLLGTLCVLLFEYNDGAVGFFQLALQRCYFLVQGFHLLRHDPCLLPHEADCTQLGDDNQDTNSDHFKAHQ
ncbi:MAG: hypothetical protein ACQES2_05070 [Pseudomonadota bacterium]